MFFTVDLLFCSMQVIITSIVNVDLFFYVDSMEVHYLLCSELLPVMGVDLLFCIFTFTVN